MISFFKKAAAVFLAAVTVLCLASCGDGKDGDSGTAKTEKGVKVTQTAAKAAKTEVYETADFSMTIPKGWKVTTGGANIYHTIRVSDPDEPLNGMFILLKAECLLHSAEGKAAWQYNYSLDQRYAVFAEAPVLANPSTEGFFKIFSQYGTFVSKVDTTYAGYAFPKYDNFTVTERFESASNLKAYALGEELLRATFTDGGKEGEGMFSASVVDFGTMPVATGRLNNYVLETVDGEYYLAYNIMAITAAKDTFIEWEGLLSECMKTLKYSDSFVSATNSASNEKVAQAAKISQNFNDTMDGIMSSWENRNKSQDIMSQKQSDATLGYERVYDTKTNEVYRATNGFSDSYDGKRYKPVTDDSMYSEPISGYIEKVD